MRNYCSMSKQSEGGERGSHGLSVISVVLVHMFVSISEVRHYLHVRITCGCCNCNSQWSNYLLRNSPFEVTNASESGTVAECKGTVTLGDELAGHKSSGRKLVLCLSPLLPLTACAGHMWRASHVRYSRWGREGEGEGDPPEARWADCGWVNK